MISSWRIVIHRASLLPPASVKPRIFACRFRIPTGGRNGRLILAKGQAKRLTWRPTITSIVCNLGGPKISLISNPLEGWLMRPTRILLPAAVLSCQPQVSIVRVHSTSRSSPRAISFSCLEAFVSLHGRAQRRFVGALPALQNSGCRQPCRFH